MATSKGVIQGYTAVAAVDSKAQVIVAAQAHGSGSGESVLLPMVERTERLRADQTVVTADAGYHSEANLKGLYELGVPALIADGLLRRRDPRFAGQEKYKALPDSLWDKTAAAKPSTVKFKPSSFAHDASTNTCICPAGKKLYSTGSHCTTKRPTAPQVPGCEARLRALSSGAAAVPTTPRAHPDPAGGVLREEPALAAGVHRTHESGDRQRARTQTLRRANGDSGTRVRELAPQQRTGSLTLRTHPKVHAQWKLYCLVHNIEKLAHHGYGR